ncbi:MFS transporter [Gaiella sp.]|uniref:MFS transporter n=1 Tax=Gaiella sp. TaxID=2663207 RepID=UPI003264D98B
MASLAAGISYANVAIGLPLLLLAEGRTAFFASSLIALNTISIALGALIALVLRRTERAVAVGLSLIAIGGVALALPPSNATTSAAAMIQGVGHGLFWVGVQAALGRRSGRRGSERAFVSQYSLYVTGTIAGAVITGLGVATFRAVGVHRSTSISLTFLLGTAAVLTALPSVRQWLRDSSAAVSARPRLAITAGFALQTPDLFLVGAMGMLVSLAPVVMSEVFLLSPLVIGFVAALTSFSKIAGAFVAGLIAAATGARLTVGIMLAASAASSALLVGAHQALLYIVLTIAAVFFGIGAWPIIVDGALARIQPRDRAKVTIAWNIREYTAIALTTVLGGYLLDAFTRPAFLLVLAAVLLGCAGISASIVLRAPTHPPSELRDAVLDSAQSEIGSTRIHRLARALHLVAPARPLPDR